MGEERAESRVRRIVRSERAKIVAPIVILTAAAFALAVLFIKPAPPKKITLAFTAEEAGAGWFAKKYQEILKRNGVTLELHQTKGSLTNLDLVSYPSDVSVAFVQSGTPPTDGSRSVVSLGALSYVPLWVFYRGAEIDDVAQLKGKRLAVGHPLSGTRALAKTLLAAAGADGPETQLLPLDRDEGAKQLEAGAVDALFVVVPAEAPAVKRLASMRGVRLLSFARADAYVRKFTYLSKLILPRGVLDLPNDVPDHDVVLLSPTLNLLARDTLHPALAYLLMRAATEVHGGAGLLDNAGQFPAALDAGFPLSAEAQRYYRNGAPFLQRYLPYWAANLIDRLWVILVPIVAVLIPLGRALPAVYRWSVRRRLYRWYGRLKVIELQLEEGPDVPVLEDMLRRLDDIEQAVNRIRTPLAYTDNVYFFREHVDIVRRRIARRLAGDTPVISAAVIAPMKSSAQ
jgi:TRAP-type uncharacterized transport system substrate-binding protein